MLLTTRLSACIFNASALIADPILPVAGLGEFFMIRTSEIKISLTRNQIRFEMIGAPEHASVRALASEWQAAAYREIELAKYDASVSVKHGNDGGAMGLYIEVGGICFFPAMRNGQRVTSGWAEEGRDPFAAAMVKINEAREEAADGEAWEAETSETISLAIEDAITVAREADEAGMMAVEMEAKRLSEEEN